MLSDGSIGVYRRRRNQSGQPLALREGERGARFLRSGPRFRLDGSTPLANLYEIDIPMPRTAAPDASIDGEIAKRDPELESALRICSKPAGLGKRTTKKPDQQPTLIDKLGDSFVSALG